VPPSIHKNKNRYHRAAGNLAFHHRDTESRSAVHVQRVSQDFGVKAAYYSFHTSIIIFYQESARVDFELRPKSEATSAELCAKSIS